jgi:hypothetical protein
MASTGSAGRGGPPPAGAEQNERFDGCARGPLDSAPRAELGRYETYDLDVETAGWDHGEQPRPAASHSRMNSYDALRLYSCRDLVGAPESAN